MRPPGAVAARRRRSRSRRPGSEPRVAGFICRDWGPFSFSPASSAGRPWATPFGATRAGLSPIMSMGNGGPPRKAAPPRADEIPSSALVTDLFGDQNANNHWLSTILQRLTRRAWQRRRERKMGVRRAVVASPLCAGLGSLVVLAFFLNSWAGRSMASWRSSSSLFTPGTCVSAPKPRAMRLMGFFLIVALWTLTGRCGARPAAIGSGSAWPSSSSCIRGKARLSPGVPESGRRGRFSDGRLPGHRRTGRSRWIAANLLGAMLFLPLAAPSQLQVAQNDGRSAPARQTHGPHWAVNTFSEVVDGMPYYELDPKNPREVSFERLSRESFFPVAILFLIGTLMVVGTWRLLRRDRLSAVLVFAILASGVAAACHFKYGVKVELLSWYFYFACRPWRSC